MLVVGIDGATWRIIHPLFERGELPNLRRLVDAGCSSALRSIEPLVSPTIWTSIASGKRPEKHGVWDFVVSSRNVRCKRIWDMASARGLRVGLCGYMVTWPPPAVNGFVIPGSFSRGVETHPAHLQPLRELDMMQRSGQRKSFSALLPLAWQAHRLGVRPGSLVRAARVLAQSRRHRNFLDKFHTTREIGAQFYTEVFVRQVRAFRTQLSFYVNMLIDATSHNYWKFMEPERFTNVDPVQVAKYRHVIPQAYRSADRSLGYVLRTLADRNTTVVVLSDHGFQSVPEAQGRTPDRTVRIQPEVLMDLLGWEKNRVRAFNIRGATYFRDREEDRDRVQKMTNDLRGVCVAGSHEPLFEVGLDPAQNLEIRLRDDIEQIDDLAVRLPDGRIIAARAIIEGDTSGISGDHHPDGILVAAGPAVRPGARLAQASVLDITPTLLALLGLPVGRDMDGRVLEEMLHPNFLARHHVQYIDTWEDHTWQFEKDAESATEELRDHLRSLGYL